MTTAPGSKNTLQGLVKKALALLKLIEQEIVVKDANLRSKAQQAEESVEDLLTALQNTEDLAVRNFNSEMTRLEKEVESTDWSKYRRRRE